MPVADRHDEAQIMVDHDEGGLRPVTDALGRQGQFFGFIVVEAGRRLVEQQQPRSERQCAHDLEPSLLAIGKNPGRPVGDDVQAIFRHQPLHLISAGGAVGAIPPAGDIGDLDAFYAHALIMRHFQAW